MCVLWTVSSYITWQIIPPLQHTETGNWPSDKTWCVNWLVHSRLASVQAGRDVRLSETFPYITKSIRPCKSVSFVYREKEKAPSGRGKQTTYVSSVTFHCVVWGVFWNTTSSEMRRCKIRHIGYYMHKFIKNKMKKELSFCILKFNCLIIFPWRGDLFLV